MGASGSGKRPICIQGRLLFWLNLMLNATSKEQSWWNPMRPSAAVAYLAGGLSFSAQHGYTEWFIACMWRVKWSACDIFWLIYLVVFPKIKHFKKMKNLNQFSPIYSCCLPKQCQYFFAHMRWILLQLNVFFIRLLTEFAIPFYDSFMSLCDF